MSQQSEVDLYCCPFCGASILKGAKHSGECFFTLSEMLRASNGQDVVLAQRVADAWKKRVSPSGYRLIPNEVNPADYQNWWQGKVMSRQTLGLPYDDLNSVIESFLPCIEDPYETSKP